MRSTFHIPITILLALGAAACGRDGTITASPAPIPLPAPTPTPAASARYLVTFQTSWSRETHPTDFPRDAHFSPLVGGTHSARVAFWQPGALASPGTERMAERGSVSPLDTEVAAGVAAGNAQYGLRGPGISNVPGSAALEFEITRDYPLVTLVSMVAPSPDWFVGVHDLSLLEGGDWTSERTITLFPYDAGTDDGITYAAPDIDAQPASPIRRLDGFPVTERGAVAPFGTFTFRRLR